MSAEKMSAESTLNLELVVLIIIQIYVITVGTVDKFVTLAVKMVYGKMSAFSMLPADILLSTFFTRITSNTALSNRVQLIISINQKKQQLTPR